MGQFQKICTRCRRHLGIPGMHFSCWVAGCKIVTQYLLRLLASSSAFRYSSPMRLLITGINGFVGGHLAEHLLAGAANDVWGLARQSSLALPDLRGHVQFVAADLGD